jgi:hypothetical protein
MRPPSQGGSVISQPGLFTTDPPGRFLPFRRGYGPEGSRSPLMTMRAMMSRFAVSAFRGRGITMNDLIIPYFINEDGAYQRGIKSGWYAVDERGNISLGPCSSREECLDKIRPMNGDTPHELWMW